MKGELGSGGRQRCGVVSAAPRASGIAFRAIMMTQEARTTRKCETFLPIISKTAAEGREGAGGGR